MAQQLAAVRGLPSSSSTALRQQAASSSCLQGVVGRRRGLRPRKRGRKPTAGRVPRASWPGQRRRQGRGRCWGPGCACSARPRLTSPWSSSVRARVHCVCKCNALSAHTHQRPRAQLRCSVHAAVRALPRNSAAAAVVAAAPLSDRAKEALLATRFLSVHQVLARKRQRAGASDGATAGGLCTQSGGDEAQLQQGFESVLVDGRALLKSAAWPGGRRKAQLPAPGVVVEARAPVPHDVRTARLLGLPVVGT